MAYSTVEKRGTALPDSGVAELNRLGALLAKSWVLSAFGAANATQVSNTAIAVFVNGTLVRIVASGGTANAIVGTVAANTTAIFVVCVGESGTLSTSKGSNGASTGAIYMPTVTAAQTPLTFIIVAATATAFNGGTNSLADGAYSVSLYNLLGPAGLAVSTEKLLMIPG